VLLVAETELAASVLLVLAELSYLRSVLCTQGTVMVANKIMLWSNRVVDRCVYKPNTLLISLLLNA